MTFDIKQIEKEVNYIFSSYPSHDMISMSKSQTYWLINRVKELENKVKTLEEKNNELIGVGGMWMSARNKLELSQQQNKQYREALEFYERGRFGGVARKALEGEE